jgi:hypothetical protein
MLDRACRGTLTQWDWRPTAGWAALHIVLLLVGATLSPVLRRRKPGCRPTSAQFWARDSVPRPR